MASPSKQLDGETPHRECKYRMIYREMIFKKEKGFTQSFIAKTTDGVCTERSSNNSWNYNGNNGNLNNNNKNNSNRVRAVSEFLKISYND